MTIFILDENPAECGRLLDDKSLDKMIKDIAHVLCNSHREGGRKVYDPFLNTIPLAYKYKNKEINKWARWVQECKANYLYLVELLYECLMEYRYRISGHKMYKILCFARDNAPDLPSCVNEEKRRTPECRSNSCLWDRETKGLPLIMPKKYIAKWLITNCFKTRDWMSGLIQSYRNYYQAKLKQRLERLGWNNGDYVYTNRNKPEWIEL